MTYLDGIVAHHRRRAAMDPRNPEEVRRSLSKSPTRGFARAIADSTELAVIAEIKRKSPSKGDINPDLVPERLAREYERGGASCLSVLTDGPHFSGSVADLTAARDAVAIPVLRKDFTVCALDVLDARLMGADAVLLIVAALTDHELWTLHELAREVGLDALVEVHDEVELERALSVNASCIGVNQRDLHTFHVDPQRAVRLAERIPSGVLAVAESGITGADDARRCADAGYRAVLVGEHLVRSADPAIALEDLRVALPS
ncbi:MAG: indole-3-glycerol phosphate synthase TrpC [Ilumatobacteraceae bacterium]|nr:indole-3-glycerol phosphate synthase TrpC [Ilumatobacteraceae bacterium]